MPHDSSINVKEIIIPTEKREKVLNELRQVLKELNIIKYLIY